MAFKFEARLLTGNDRTLKRVGELVRHGIDAAYFEKWDAAAVFLRIAGEGIATKKILRRKRTLKGKPFGAQIEQIKTHRQALCKECRVAPSKMLRIVRSLSYLRKVGNRAAHFGIRRGGPFDPNKLSVDLARSKVENILEDLYAW